MTNEHLTALLQAAQAATEGEWHVLPGERTLTLHVAHGGVPLNVTKISRLKVQEGLVFAQNVREELSVARLEDVFAGAVEGEGKITRKAGFR